MSDKPLRPYIHIAAVQASELRTRLTRIKFEGDDHSAALAQEGLNFLVALTDALDKDNTA